jgi:hypothetical protein
MLAKGADCRATTTLAERIYTANLAAFEQAGRSRLEAVTLLLLASNPQSSPASRAR